MSSYDLRIKHNWTLKHIKLHSQNEAMNRSETQHEFMKWHTRVWLFNSKSRIHRNTLWKANKSMVLNKWTAQTTPKPVWKGAPELGKNTFNVGCRPNVGTPILEDALREPEGKSFGEFTLGKESPSKGPSLWWARFDPGSVSSKNSCRETQVSSSCAFGHTRNHLFVRACIRSVYLLTYPFVSAFPCACFNGLCSLYICKVYPVMRRLYTHMCPYNCIAKRPL